ncbi:MAG: DUF3179 domain-containing protein [Mariprofundaceae bacterium]|nr:DUF3179 domain-containing protein [Mariprofundaceae bacterium]
MDKHTIPRTIRILLPVILLSLSGFTLSPSLVPQQEIVSGGPPKDGIPALSRPVIESADTANQWLAANDRILGVVVNGKPRAYPLRILNWHEIVNDRIADHPLVITYCPLCGSGMAFDTTDQFGVSGLLYQSDVLLYDKRSESLWSQLMMMAVAGPRRGENMPTLPVSHTTWRALLAAHPDTTVLSRNTGYHRDYSRNPYAGYELSPRLYFDVSHKDDRLHPKAWVIGLKLGTTARAWAVADVRQHGEIHDHSGQKNLLLRYRHETVEISDGDTGEVLYGTVLYWFAWAAFHPETSLFESGTD